MDQTGYVTRVLTNIEGVDYSPRQTEGPTEGLTFACQLCGAAVYMFDLPRHSMWHHSERGAK